MTRQGECEIEKDVFIRPSETDASKYIYDAEPFRMLAACCTSKDELARFRKMETGDEFAKFAEFIRKGDSGECRHAVAAQMHDIGATRLRRIVARLELREDPARYMILDDKLPVADFTSAFYGGFYMPFTEKLPMRLEDGSTLDARSHYEAHVSLMNRFLSALAEITTGSPEARRANELWRTVLTRFEKRLANPHEELSHFVQEDYARVFFALEKAIRDCLPVARRLGDSRLPPFYDLESDLAILARRTPTFERFYLLCKLLERGLDIACSGKPNFRLQNVRWFAAALELLGEDPFRPLDIAADLHHVQHLQMSFTPVLRALGRLLSLYRASHPKGALPRLMATIRDILAECPPDEQTHALFLIPERLLVDEVTGGWTFSNLTINRLAQCCNVPEALRYYREVYLVNTHDHPVDIRPTTREEYERDLYAAVATMYQKGTDTAKRLLEQLAADGSITAVSVLMEGKSSIMDMLDPVYTTYHLPYTRYRDAYMRTKGDDLDMPAKCEAYLSAVDRLIAALATATHREDFSRELKARWAKILAEYRQRLRNPTLSLVCSVQRKYFDETSGFILFIAELGARLRAPETIEATVSEILPQVSADCVALLKDTNLVVHRIDERQRSRTEAEEKKRRRREGEEVCLDLLLAYLARPVDAIQTEHKRAYEDLLSLPDAKSTLADYGITSESEIRKAVRNAGNRRKAAK